MFSRGLGGRSEDGSSQASMPPVGRSPVPSASWLGGGASSKSSRERPADIGMDIGQRSSSDRDGFTDLSQVHCAARHGPLVSNIFERSELSENPEDPERTPDLPEELQNMADNARLDQEKASVWAFRCRSVALLLSLVGVIAVALMCASPLGLRRWGQGVADEATTAAEAASAAATQQMSPLHMPWSKGSTSAKEAGEASSTPDVVASAREVQPTSQQHPQRLAPQPQSQQQQQQQQPQKQASSQRSLEICNRSVPLPKVDLRTWNLPDGWRRVCERKNVKDKFPLDRNWCWYGLNTMCHWNLKLHKSWQEFQDMAAHEGLSPSRADQPFNPIDRPELCDRPERGRVRSWTTAEQEMARRWFREHVAVYVISLPGRGDRRWQGIKQRLDELQIWAERVPGVDMTVDGALDGAVRAGFVPDTFNFTKAQANAYDWKQSMGSILGTVGCASAHFKTHMKVIADGSPLALVMEDDSYPSDDFVPRLWSLVREELPCDWEVLALLSRCGYGRCVSKRLMRVMPDGNEPAWRCRQGSNWGMHAVLYNTEQLPKVRELWRQTVFNEERPHCMDVDVALASISDQVGFYAVPAVQDPGFVMETNHRSARWDINQAAQSTTSATTTSMYVPAVPSIKPGEPWPGAWNFG